MLLVSASHQCCRSQLARDSLPAAPAACIVPFSEASHITSGTLQDPCSTLTAQVL